MHLEFDKNEYKVISQGITIELLPKEFSLLNFLYQNRGITFSREQLLNSVWSLEYPVDRTVDDHIYRLRRKLASLQGFEIRTVRGLGYSLTVQNSTSLVTANPTTYDLDLRETMREVFVKYHQYGQGKSMITLARQQDILGFELDPYYSVYIHFVQGDLEWLLNTDEVPLADRMYSLIIFHMFSGDPQEKLIYCEHVLEKKMLSPMQHLEMEFLNILDLYTLAGEPNKALDRLELSNKIFAEPGYENFIPQTAITEMFVHLVAGTQDHELNELAKAIEVLLHEKPFLREIGSYKIVMGLWKLRQKEWYQAELLLDEGLQVLDMSGFIPLRLLALHRIYYYCEKFPPKQALQRKYVRIFEEEQVKHGLNQLIGPLEIALLKVLNAL